MSQPARYRATIEYAGDRFHGSQVQPDVRTVQGALEEALTRLSETPIRVLAAGRTDTGVHATAQETCFELPTTWDPQELRRALGAVLPDDVAVFRVEPAPAPFHPRFDATARRYEYYVDPRPAGPIRAGRVWGIGERIDDGLLREAARALLGEHDFRRFARSGQPDVNPVCVVERAEWTATDLGDFRFVVVADRFLHRMVRYFVATMIDVGAGRRGLVQWYRLVHEGSGRPPAPAPSTGLYLTGVRYTGGWNRDPGVPGLWPVPARQREEAGA